MRRILLAGFAIVLASLIPLTAWAVAPDPRTLGPFTTANTLIDEGCSFDLDGKSVIWSDPAFGFSPVMVSFGDHDFSGSDTRCPGSPAALVNMKVRVYHPGTAGVVAAGGPFPLVAILHGQQIFSIAGFEGYDYLGNLLASHGYIVASIDGRSLLDSTIKSRGEHIREHLRRFVTRNAAGSGSFLSGKIDMSRATVIGHSRGGDAVVAAWEWQRVSPDPGYAIAAIVAIAPVQFFGRIPGFEPDFISHVRDVGYQILHGAHDCDVADFQGLRQYDRAADIRAVGATPKSMVYVRDANHNFFNHIWATMEGSECGGAPVLSETDAQDVAKGYIHAFLDLAVKGSSTFKPYLTGEQGSPVAGTAVAVDFQAPGPDFMAADHFEELPGVKHKKSRNSVPKGSVSTGAVKYKEEFAARTQPSPLDTYQGETFAAHLTWTSLKGKFLEKSPMKAPFNPGGLDHLSFRAGQVVGFPAGAQDFDVRLLDSHKSLSNKVAVSSVTSIPEPFPSLFFGPPFGDKTVMNVVRIPLSAFTGVDLTSIKQIQLLFDKVGFGEILVDDVRFTK